MTIATDFFQRVVREARITVQGAQESVLAISERVNRRVQSARLQWQVANTHSQTAEAYREAGRRLYGLLAESTGTDQAVDEAGLERLLRDAAGSVRILRADLTKTEAAIRALEIEALHEVFVQMQQELVTRSAGISRVVVAPGAPAEGLPEAALNLPAAVRIGAVLRGPVLLASPEPLRAGDIVFLLGPQPLLRDAFPALTGDTVSKTAKPPS